MTVSGKTTTPKSCLLFCNYFKDDIPCICATLCKLSKSKWYKMRICEGCCVVRRCMSDNTTEPCENLPKVKKSCRDHFKLPNNFRTEVLENILNSIPDQLLDFLLIFKLVNKSVWNSGTQFNLIQMKKDMPFQISLGKRGESSLSVKFSLYTIQNNR